MKKILFSIVFLLPTLVYGFVIAVESNKPALFITMLNGKVYFTDLTDSPFQVYDFAISPDEGAIEFADDSRLIAYVIRQEQTWQVGIGDTESWQFSAFDIETEPTVEHITLDWFPSDTHLVLSHISNDENARSSIIDRDLVTVTTLDRIDLQPFPYKCNNIIMLQTDSKSLQCELVSDWSDENMSSYAIFQLSENNITFVNEPHESIVKVHDIVQKNWDWINNVGIVFFDSGTGELERDFYFLPENSIQPLRLSIDSPWTGGFDLSLDGSNLIFQEPQPDRWSIYDMQSNEIVTTLKIPDFVSLAKVQWYSADGDIVYATYDSNREVSTIHVSSLNGNDKIVLEIEGIVARINVVQR